MTRQPPRLLDSALVRRRFDRAAAGYAGADALPRELARRLGERLDFIRITPRRIVDLGSGPGADRAWLQSRFPEADYLACDFSPAMLARMPDATTGGGLFARLAHLSARWRGPGTLQAALCAAAARLPLPRASVDLVWSNCLLPWQADPLPVMQEIVRTLAVGGLFLFSSLGPDTCRELRSAFGRERVHDFIDMHDLGDMLVAAGLADPVMEMETITLTYPDPLAMVGELRALGASNALAERPVGLFGRGRWQAALARLARDADGRIPLTCEAIFGHAWKPAPRVTAAGEAIVRFHRPGSVPSPSGSG